MPCQLFTSDMEKLLLQVYVEVFISASGSTLTAWTGTNLAKLFLQEDDVTALAGAAAYRGPQSFNCVSVCLCIVRSPDWRGLETSGLLEEFAWTSSHGCSFRFWNRTTGRLSANLKFAKITFSRSVILGYLLLAEPKHIANHPDKRNREATSLLSPQQFRPWGSMVRTRRTKRTQRGNSPFLPYPIFHEGLKEQQSLWHARRMLVELWQLHVHVHACAWMRTVCRTERMPLITTRLIVDKMECLVPNRTCSLIF